MPQFKITGRGKETGRKRTRQYQAIDLETAKSMAEQDGTEIEKVDYIVMPSAEQALIELAQGMNAKLPESPSRFDCVLGMLERAIVLRLPIQIVKGDAFNNDMEEVPWVANIWPRELRRTVKGIRAIGYVEPVGDYLIMGDDQRLGERQYLVEDIQSATPHIKET